jgi:hypothetical protein
MESRTIYTYDALVDKFTGKERDSESTLDNFGARYYSSSLGRFDKLLSNPQIPRISGISVFIP